MGVMEGTPCPPSPASGAGYGDKASPPFRRCRLFLTCDFPASARYLVEHSLLGCTSSILRLLTPERIVVVLAERLLEKVSVVMRRSVVLDGFELAHMSLEAV